MVPATLDELITYLCKRRAVYPEHGKWPVERTAAPPAPTIGMGVVDLQRRGRRAVALQARRRFDLDDWGPTATNSLADQRLRVVFADGTWVER